MGKNHLSASTQLTSIPAAVLTELNRQLTLEQYSVSCAYAMSAALENMQWPGMAKYWRKQAKDEQGHAKKLFKYMVDRDSPPVIEAVPAPPAMLTDPLGIFNYGLSNSKDVTVSIDKISQLAHDAGDYATFHFLAWYVKDQVKEERDILDAVAQLQHAGSDMSALLHVDHRIGKAR